MPSSFPVCGNTGQQYAQPSKNPLTTHLKDLQRHKHTLPQAQLICISASHNVTTMAALLRLATSVGPYIAVLQVHADIIDDWSLQAARKLTYLAKKYNFLIWEAGRILNCQKRFGTAQSSISDEEITRSIDMARKRYTKGVVSVAAWAGLASTWVIGPEEYGRGADRLIPALRRAARERVALMTMSVQTEISAGDAALQALNGAVESDSDYGEEGDTSNSEGFSGELNADANDDLNARKGSVISLTRTITQHTEQSKPSSDAGSDEEDSALDFEHESEDTSTQLCDVPSPPLLSRGVIFCVPTEHGDSIGTPYRDAAVSAARDNRDFVAGFVTEESWVDVCRHRRFSTLCGHGEALKEADEEMIFAVFSPLEERHVPDLPEKKIGDTDLGMGQPSSESVKPWNQQRPRSSTHSRQIGSLHDLVERAVATRDVDLSPETDTSSRNTTEVLYIPVISMSA